VYNSLYSRNIFAHRAKIAPSKNVFSVWDASVTDIQLSIFENISAEADGVNMLASAGHVEGMRFFLII